MGAASLGYIPPTVGALLQEAIDVAVILNALRATWGDATGRRAFDFVPRSDLAGGAT
jgi:hypothetical protein